MSTIETGGPAFPTLGHIVDGEWETFSQFTGITVRDYFAAKAMAALFPLTFTLEVTDGVSPIEHLSDRSYEMADAMLSARSKS